MTGYVALLRAVNVGGSGKLPMTALQTMGVEAGFRDVQTYIASGNLVLAAAEPAAAVQHALEERLEEFFGRLCRVFVRSAAEMAAVAAGNPFPDVPGKWTHAVFLDAAPPPDALEQVRSQTTERVALGVREIYIAYGEGMGRSRLKVPAAADGTARNMNTVAKLAALAAARD